MKDVRPAVWRVLEVPGNLTLHHLHRVLQEAMGWEDTHLYLFHVGQQLYGDPSLEWDMPVAHAARTKLEQIAATTSSFTYEYDLGDSWVHEITVGSAQTNRGWRRLSSMHRRGRGVSI